MAYGYVYSTSLARARDGSGDSDPFPVPDGSIWVVRNITMYNGNEVPLVTASVSATDGITVFANQWIAVTGSVVWNGRIVLDQPGDFIQLHATFGVDFWVSGYQLTPG